MKRICIVPAKANSTRLENKNMRLFNGKPLVEHTFYTICGLFDKVLVTSDSLKILELARKYDYETDLRPGELATPESKVIDTIVYYFEKMKIIRKFDQIWMCLPTCPLRTAEDIIHAQNTLCYDYNGIISVTDYEFPPTLGLTIKNNYLSDWHSSQPWIKGNTRTQDQEKVYRPNGAIYGMGSVSFLAYKNFYKGKTGAYYMPRNRSIDIDTYEDFIYAELLANVL